MLAQYTISIALFWRGYGQKRQASALAYMMPKAFVSQRDRSMPDESSSENCPSPVTMHRTHLQNTGTRFCQQQSPTDLQGHYGDCLRVNSDSRSKLNRALAMTDKSDS